ncbi:hypothetical protein, partial [Micromonospora globosa]|uniref:hypothetical protein n=1 Tax=Micromonospora globosa TaxID=47863 RepID=UPI001E64FB94
MVADDLALLEPGAAVVGDGAAVALGVVVDELDVVQVGAAATLDEQRAAVALDPLVVVLAAVHAVRDGRDSGGRGRRGRGRDSRGRDSRGRYRRGGGRRLAAAGVLELVGVAALDGEVLEGEVAAVDDAEDAE